MVRPGLLKDEGGERATIDFIVWLTAKTERGRTQWLRQGDLITAAIGRITVNFLTFEITEGVPAWRRFAMRDDECGEEVFRATPRLAAQTNPPVYSVIDALFRVITKRRRRTPARLRTSRHSSALSNP